ncbi:Methenyltetrahydrofolate cyclohydrolase [Chloroherpeton thalassium ATCC 35110]|uniref:Bifunctional protein FolD n=1 Tax=Chloroherpeton thalassium (strain ATCC 35110 / GB-78) TaxID=517418 RepID=FOLD_CHLT3|nr:bifunctional methylenetetrahydrofolate dehydrogenase/methenyltetrahydrofolate cyclohydrolase FolD [Chloroherpeton thalassium]B3QUL4.1 RecName: Full=Bifunctional protein FolD; Includes: RecName: Full=Methylenetetrahydrofolate dehydrogenase; Includes: RecName: Full=Methenyltetrahydrofolate cyclohydrolase [Chloroherpeton thalassium ATCC 35110]ACF12920.1 Methenyltetrahydrofolate cyclohydrolase [Chloroherpeton thalassium ATCC 35110]
MVVLDGKKLSQEIKAELKTKVEQYKQEIQKVPGLTVIIVGEDPASQVYVRNKAKSCNEIGMASEVIELPASTSQEELLKKIADLNHNPNVHGILVQQPLPKHIDEFAVTLAIAPEKDVDGFHPENVGRLVLGHLDKCFVSCTPFGIIEILKRYNIETKGKHCVIVGRSNIVGKPMANLMVQKLAYMNCTVTVCHSATPDIATYTKQADILIAAIGKARFITGDMIKAGAVVIDVGINRIEATNTKSGYRLVGDVDFEAASQKASAITPVPGGVGPMTISMLLANTMKSFEHFLA